MLATTQSACSRAWRIRAIWPSWRLPMVGTKATRPAPARAARRLSMVSVDLHLRFLACATRAQ